MLDCSKRDTAKSGREPVHTCVNARRVGAFRLVSLCSNEIIMTIPQFSRSDRPSDIAQALGEIGCVVVTDLLNAVDRTAVRDELAPYMERVKVAQDDPAAFYPGLTRRSTALVARSETVGRMVLHDRTIELCDHFLIPNGEFGYQLHVSAALEVGPGARIQVLHREHDGFTFFPHPRPNLIVASMWAITDFRQDAAEMSAGSVLYWLGGTLHGAGANTSQDWRYGVILTYSCGWLRQEENQYLDVPPEVARRLSPALRDIIGYKMHSGLGFSVNRDVGAVPD
jgi:ectoine hydroxylase-related dioxygenase (phytanoyl-CoA dioxygenase family)